MARSRWSRRLGSVLVGALLGAPLLAACSSGPGSGTPAIPGFPGPGAAPATSAAQPRDTLLPTDCNQLLAKENLPNLLGMPLGSADVRALRDVPAPTVGRLERVTCNYTSTGGPGAPRGGALVLKVLSSGYTTPDAARAQAAVTTQVEQRNGVGGVPVPLGSAQATFYDDPEGPLLVVVLGRVTTSLTVYPGGPVAREQARPVLTDLAQRVLPVLVPTA